MPAHEPNDTMVSTGAPGATGAGPAPVGALGPYRIVKKLGEGGMGAVYAAVDTRLDRQLALKVMLPEFAADRAAKERFLREAKAAAKIAHDNVVTVYEADERDGIPYIAMQFLEGYPLDRYLKERGNPTVQQVLRVAVETAAGLEAAHKLGLVHRDIKPANLWLEAPHGRVKVLDFGLAKPVDGEVELTKSGAVVGTPAYMSPEQARAEKVDHRSDLFSLGSVLYRLCTGKPPFHRPTTMAVLMALGTEDPRPVRELNPDVPESLAALIHELLAKNPDARPQSAAEVVKRVRAIAEELAPHARNPELSVSQPQLVRPQVVYAVMPVAVAEVNPFADLDSPDTELDAAPPSAVPAPARPKAGAPWPWLVAAVVLAAAAVGGVMYAMKGPGKSAEGQKPVDPPQPPPKAQPKGKTPVAPPPSVPPGKRALQFAPGDTATAEQVPHRKTTEVTVEAWVSFPPTGNPNAQQIVTLPNGQLARLLVEGTDGLSFYTYHGGATTGVPLRPNQRTHVAGVNDGKERRLYVDGKFVASTPDAGIVPDDGTAGAPRPLQLGSAFFAGTVEQVRVSTTGRYAKDFTPPATFTKDKDTFALYLFEEGYGDTLKDSSGNGYHCKITGAKWVAADPDRRAAEYALSVGGAVHLNGQPAQLPNKELPNEPFALTGVDFYTNGGVSDAGLAAFAGCKNLTHLVIWGCAQVTDAGLVHFTQNTGLKYLQCGGTVGKITNVGFAAFKDCKELTKLTFAQCSVTSEGYQYFKGCTALTELHIHQMPVSQESLAVFAGCKELTVLDLSTGVTDAWLANFKDCEKLYSIRLHDERQVTDAGLAHFKNCKALQSLDLTNTKVTDAGLEHLKNCKALQHLDLPNTKLAGEGLKHLAGFNNLANLNLDGTKVTDEGLKHLPTLPGMRTLGLNYTALTDEGLKLLQQQKGLTSLNVVGTKVTPKGLADFHAAVPECKIAYDGGVIEAVDVDRKAAEWVLRIGGRIHVNGEEREIKAAPELPQGKFALTRVYLQDNQKVTDGDLAHFSGCTALSLLSLPGTPVTDAGMTHFKSCTSLTRLNLAGTRVTSAGLAHFKGCKNLTQLSLGGAPVTDAGVAHFKGCKDLAWLGLDGTAVTDTGLAHFKGCKNLTYVNVRNTKITVQAIEELRAAVPGCKIEHDGGVIEPKK